jgi:hypothetical protein
MNTNKAIVTKLSIKLRVAKKLRPREEKMLINYSWKLFKPMLWSRDTIIRRHTEIETVN